MLEVISRSTFDLQPVLDTLIETAARLCGTETGGLAVRDGDGFRYIGWTGDIVPEYTDVLRETVFKPGRDSIIGRIALGGATVHVADIAADPEYKFFAASSVGGLRTALGVALLREGEPIGAITLVRRRVEPFTDRQIELVRTFADQAVIAMENARLLTETREALEQQTATAEVLQVINASPGDLTPVFDAILEKAHSLCDIAQGSLELYDAELFRAVAVRGFSDEFAEILRQGNSAAGNPATRPLLEGSRFAHILDLAETDYTVTRSAAELDAVHTLLCVPLRREGALLGMIASARREVRPFSEKEIALLENFAAQAVIAMENARLITETREALEQQTATAEVLQVINSSPGDLAPVFDAILEKAHSFCGATYGSLHMAGGESFRAVAVRGLPEAFADLIRPPFQPGPNHPVRQLIGGASFATVINSPEYDDPIIQSAHKLSGMRTALYVPLRKENALLGYIVASRPEVRPSRTSRSHCCRISRRRPSSRWRMRG